MSHPGADPLPSADTVANRSVKQPSAEDPLVKSSRHEAVVVLIAWFVAMCYTVVYCYKNGFNRDIESLTFVLGFPDWVFWGIVVPWLSCVAFGAWFAYFHMTDADLGRSEDETGAEL